jgi:hypothetical protein
MTISAGILFTDWGLIADAQARANRLWQQFIEEAA